MSERRPPLYLRGNEDCSVDMACQSCDTGGKPIVWYDGGYGGGNPYEDVPTARTVNELRELGRFHLFEVHGMVTSDV